MSSTGYWKKKREVLSVVIEAGFVEEIELAMGLDGICSERRERASKKDAAINSLYLFLFPYSVCQALN